MSTSRAKIKLDIACGDGAKIKGVREMDDDRGLAVYLLWLGASEPTLKRAQDAYIQACKSPRELAGPGFPTLLPDADPEA